MPQSAGAEWLAVAAQNTWRQLHRTSCDSNTEYFEADAQNTLLHKHRIYCSGPAEYSALAAQNNLQQLRRIFTIAAWNTLQQAHGSEEYCFFFAPKLLGTYLE